MNHSIKTYLWCLVALTSSSVQHSDAIIKYVPRVRNVEFSIDGQREASVGDIITYSITFKGLPHTELGDVLLYYYPPKGLECIDVVSSAPNKFAVDYSDDYNRVYGRTVCVRSGDRAQVTVRLKVLKEAAFLEESANASYFSLIVCPKDKEAQEYYRRQGLRVVR